MVGQVGQVGHHRQKRCITDALYIIGYCPTLVLAVGQVGQHSPLRHICPTCPTERNVVGHTKTSASTNKSGSLVEVSDSSDLSDLWASKIAGVMK